MRHRIPSSLEAGRRETLLRESDGRTLPIAAGVKYVTKTAPGMKILFVALILGSWAWGLLRAIDALGGNRPIPFDSWLITALGFVLLVALPDLFHELEITLDTDRQLIVVAMKGLSFRAEESFSFHEARLVLLKWDKPYVDEETIIDTSLYLLLPEHKILLGSSELERIEHLAENLQTETGLTYSKPEGDTVIISCSQKKSPVNRCQVV